MISWIILGENSANRKDSHIQGKAPSGASIPPTIRSRGELPQRRSLISPKFLCLDSCSRSASEGNKFADSGLGPGVTGASGGGGGLKGWPVTAESGETWSGQQTLCSTNRKVKKCDPLKQQILTYVSPARMFSDVIRVRWRWFSRTCTDDSVKCLAVVQSHAHRDSSVVWQVALSAFL